MIGRNILSSQRLRNFLSWVKSKEFLVFLFFFFISAFFWVMLAVKDVTEKDIYVKVELINKPEKYILSKDDIEPIRVTVRDNGYNIFSYLTFLNKVQPVKVDLQKKEYKDESNQVFRVDKAELTKLIKAELEKSTVVASIKPDFISINYYHKEDYKNMPVLPDTIGKPKDRYFVTNIRTIPDSVKIYFASKLNSLSSIPSVKTKSISIEGIDKTTSVVVPLDLTQLDFYYMKAIPDSVTVEVSVDIIGMDSITVPIIPINEPQGKHLVTHPSKVKVKFTGPSSKLKLVNKDMFSVYVDYKDVDTSTTQSQYTLPVKIKDMPDFIKKAVLSIDSVPFTIDISNEKE